MAVWRCPHCATPQPESSRCWVCRRSTTSCATCRHFRKAVAGGLGMCGLDPRRSALDGTEMRPCWVAAAPSPEPEEHAGRAVGSGPDGREVRRPRTFVPVEAVPVAAEPVPEPVMVPAPPARPVPGRWWLWGDPEPWPEP